MLFAVISDVQGNLAALEAVLAALKRDHPGVDRIVSAGDLVGRGPHPNEVIDLYREHAIDSVRGNYDDAVAFDRMGSGCDFASRGDEDVDREAIEWTRSVLTEENREFLRSLPRDMRLLRSGRDMKVERDSGDARTNEYRKTFYLRAFFGGLARGMPNTSKRILLVHGSPRALNEFIREDTATSILTKIGEDAQADVVISGHSATDYRREAAGMTFIGVGPVNDDPSPQPTADYLVVEIAATMGPEREVVRTQFCQVPYDAARQVEGIQNSGLPKQLAAGYGVR